MILHSPIRLWPSVFQPLLERAMDQPLRRRIAKPLLWFVTLLIVVQLSSCSPVQASESITAESLAVQVEQGTAPLILDVRTAEEYAQGHVPGAVNIYFKDIPNQLDTIRGFNSSEVIVYCERGVRAGIADKLLTEAGFSSVVQLTGNMPAWRAAELPITTSE